MKSILRERLLVLDGAMGTQLQGLAEGSLPEMFNLTNPEAVRAVHQRYLASGSDLIAANSFGANKAWLKKFGLEDRLRELNLAAVAIAREAGAKWVIGALGPTGEISAPMGTYTYDDFYAAFRPQVEVLLEGNVNAIIIETILDVIELKAAIAAVRDVSKDVPLIAQVSLMNGRTLNGTDLPAVGAMLDAMDVDVLGINCVALSEELPGYLTSLAAVTDKPLIVQPNAGMPDEKDCHHLDLQEWRRVMEMVIGTPGVGMVGGCCGTNPEAIRILREIVDGVGGVRQRTTPKKQVTYLAGRTGVVALDLENGPYLIGERINPTDRSDLADALRVEDWYTICDEGVAQVEAGAVMLDVNVGLSGINQPQVMADLVQQLQLKVSCPLVLDSSDVAVLEAGLKVLVGKPVINSCTAHYRSLQALLPMARRYGAAIIGLCMNGEGVPDTAEERVQYGKKIIATAHAQGIKDVDIFLDPLVMPAAVGVGEQETLQTLRILREETGVGFVVGISNVSYGLPNRSFLNRVFLAMVCAAGLSLAIANPFDEKMMPLMHSVRLILGKDPNCQGYLDFHANQ